jgi:hypothetical protein
MEDEKVSISANTKNKKNQKMIKSIDIAIVVIACFFILFVFVISEDMLLKIILGSIFIIVTCIYGIILYETRTVTAGQTKIRKLVLLNNQGVEIDEWIIENKTALIIGKSSQENKVDIDLTGTEYESLISLEHAVLNCVSGKWYIEDIDSINCVGIKKANKLMKNQLREGSPHPISSGDTLYIANTRMLVK